MAYRELMEIVAGLDEERTGDKAALSDLLGISERTLERHIASGVIVPAEKPRPGKRTIFYLQLNVQYYADFLLDRAIGDTPIRYPPGFNTPWCDDDGNPMERGEYEKKHGKNRLGDLTGLELDLKSLADL